jgi:hypothetical protein
MAEPVLPQSASVPETEAPRPKTPAELQAEAEEKEYVRLLYLMFDKFTLNDQRAFYRNAVRKNRSAASQVNKVRALFALLTGLASALAGLLVAATPPELCPRVNQFETVAMAISTPAPEVTQEFEATLEPSQAAAEANVAPTLSGCALTTLVVPFLLIMSVVAPALGGAFTTLADLYQWDKLINIYDAALENIEIADAKSPIDDMELPQYKAQFKGYAEGTLSVMRDETAQWGQVIRTPKQIDEFVEQELRRAGENAQQITIEQVRDAVLKELASVQAATENANKMIEEMHKTFIKDSAPAQPSNDDDEQDMSDPPAGQ